MKDSTKKRVDTLVWTSLVGAMALIGFLLDKIAVQKGIWS